VQEEAALGTDRNCIEFEILEQVEKGQVVFQDDVANGVRLPGFNPDSAKGLNSVDSCASGRSKTVRGAEV